ncbi:hypothetical protein [uncultured Roseibium sp.]|nr:hypothetical protein [uncultured Roseibium sp.]
MEVVRRQRASGQKLHSARLLVTEIDHGKVLGKLGESAAEQLGIATEDTP